MARRQDSPQKAAMREMMRAEDMPGFFRIPADNRDLNYDNYFSKGIRN